MKPNLVFTWLGSKLPWYTIQSLYLNLRYSCSRIHLVTDEANITYLLRFHSQLVSQIALIPIDSFYNQPHNLSAKNYYGDLGYRDGFWLRTFERFYVLDSLLSSRILSTFFHAELDNICFGLDRLQTYLDSLSFSSFFVQDNISRGVLSLTYLKGPTSLSRLLSFLESLPPDHKFNDMHDLGAFLQTHPNGTAALPNESALLAKPKWNHIPLSKVHGICDANAIGQYLLGLDYRITRRLTNLFKNENLFINLHHVNFVLSKHDFNTDQHSIMNPLPALVYKPTGQVIPIYNIHVHSKSFIWLSSPPLMRILFTLVNLRIAIPILSISMLRYRLTRFLYSLSGAKSKV